VVAVVAPDELAVPSGDERSLAIGYALAPAGRGTHLGWARIGPLST
jgi:hypothetical protein